MTFKRYTSLRLDASDEMRDCAVLALASVTGWPYEKAHSVAKAAGRKDKDGFASFKLMQSPTILREFALQCNDMVHRWVKRRMRYAYGEDLFIEACLYPTLTQWLKMPGNKRGRFYLSTGYHSFAVVDGVVFDHCLHPRARVTNVYKFIPKVPA